MRFNHLYVVQPWPSPCHMIFGQSEPLSPGTSSHVRPSPSLLQTPANLEKPVSHLTSISPYTHNSNLSLSVKNPNHSCHAFKRFWWRDIKNMMHWWPIIASIFVAKFLDYQILGFSPPSTWNLDHPPTNAQISHKNALFKRPVIWFNDEFCNT